MALGEKQLNVSAEQIDLAGGNAHPSPCNACNVVKVDVAALAEQIAALTAALEEQTAALSAHRASDATRWARAETYYAEVDAFVASSVNHTIEGQAAVDVTALVQSEDGWTVESEEGLGGIVTLKVKNQNYSSGVYWINGSVRDFSSGLYTENTPIEYKEEVVAGDIVRSKDMQEVWFTPYRRIA